MYTRVLSNPHALKNMATMNVSSMRSENELLKIQNQQLMEQLRV